MSQQKVQQRFQEREKELKELQQAVESFKVSIVDQRRHTISLLSSSQRERERERGPYPIPLTPLLGTGCLDPFQRIDWFM